MCSAPRDCLLVLLAGCALVAAGACAVRSAGRVDGQSPHGTLRPVTLDGLGNPHNYGFHRLYHFQGWLWTVSGNSVEGAVVYRSHQFQACRDTSSRRQAMPVETAAVDDGFRSPIPAAWSEAEHRPAARAR